MSNLCAPWGAPPPKKFGGGAKFFSNPLGSGDVVNNFFSNSPWKDVPKNGFKILVAPEKFQGGVEIRRNFAIFRLLCPLLQNSQRYRQSENGWTSVAPDRRSVQMEVGQDV